MDAHRTLSAIEGGWTLLTGATGFIGQHLLARLLQSNRRVVIGVRGDLESAWARLLAAPSLVEMNLAKHRHHDRIRLVRVELDHSVEMPAEVVVLRVVHAAGSVRFLATADGDPHRTNVAGTQQVLDWAATHGVREFHLVSTAYVCGDCAIGPEAISDSPPRARNAYETSKWKAESAARRWAQQTGGTLTVHRPSIVVGDFSTGAASKFDGFYLMLRAAQQIGRRFGSDDAPVHVRIEGSPTGQENIVPVDWLADMIVGIVNEPVLHGRVYNLVNPRSPNHMELKAAVESHCRIDLQFVDRSRFAALDLTLSERLFADMSRELCPYVNSAQQFARENAVAAEELLGLPCPQFDLVALRRLVRFAIESKFGRRAVRNLASPECADYFERFLPQTIPQCPIIRAAAMDVTVRFRIGDANGDNWVCRFEQGRLTQVLRDCGVTVDDVAYHATDHAFWQCVSGQVDPQELFQSGEVEIFGDVEKGLMIAFLLQAFAQQFPCDPAMLAASLTRRSA